MKLEKYLPREICKWIEEYGKTASDITFIKEANMYMSCDNKIYDSPFFITQNALEDIVKRICNGSIYASQNTLKKGYVTIENSHRVGVGGTIVTNETGEVFLRDINAVNIRIARNIPNASKNVIDSIKSSDGVYNTLIISPPGCGKTTILKDLIIKLSKYLRVGIVDERGELSECATGTHAFFVKNCNKSDGILMLLRSMAPQVIITDEIGGEDDENAIAHMINAGVKIICSVHGFDENDILKRKTLKNLVNNGIFERIIVLSKKNGVGTVEKIIFSEEVND